MLNMVLMNEQYSHELPPELIQRSLNALREEGVVNTKQLGELEEKDYDEIKLPALIKSKLRKVREEARAQSAVAANPVGMDSQEVADEVREFMEARTRVKDGEANEKPPEPVNAVVPEETNATQEEEDGTFKSLVWAIMNCPTCKGKETISCFRNCRYGGALLNEGQKLGVSVSIS